MKIIKKSVFRAYDIRGEVDKDFDPEWVQALGRACGVFFQRYGHKSAILGRDCRHSSPTYLKQLTTGLVSCGMDVLILGMVPTPVFYYAMKNLERHAGIIVTASHNPPEYNGFKIWSGQTTLHTDDIQEIMRIMQAGRFPEKTGIVCEHNIIPTYIKDLASKTPLEHPIHVVLDGGNGAAGTICAELLETAGARVTRMFCEPDGDFPHHHPDPVVEENIVDLKRKVVSVGADLGIGLDGDGDRLGVVDEKGQTVPGDRLLAIFARDMLARRPGATILAEAKCSHLLYRDIENHGGRAIMSVTGHSVMKARMLETNALLAGEMSGHMFFAEDYYGFDDASLAALRLLDILVRAKRPLSSFLEDWPTTYSTPELRAACPEDAKSPIVERAAAMLRADYETVEIDGVRATFPDGWALVRASNTQPALSMRFEAESPEGLQRIRDLVEAPVLRWIAEYRDK